MVMRKCPECGEENYSADTVTEVWQCCKCKADIPRSQERTILHRSIHTGSIRDLDGVEIRDDFRRKRRSWL